VTEPFHAQQCLAVTYEKLGRHAGNSSKALEWLERALQDPGLDQLKVDSLLDPLRKEPRFHAVTRELTFLELSGADRSQSLSVASERPVCGNLRDRAVRPVVARLRHIVNGQFRPRAASRSIGKAAIASRAS